MSKPQEESNKSFLGAKENISKWNRGSPRPATSSLLNTELPVVAGAPAWPVPAYCAQGERGWRSPGAGSTCLSPFFYLSSHPDASFPRDPSPFTFSKLPPREWNPLGLRSPPQLAPDSNTSNPFSATLPPPKSNLVSFWPRCSLQS